MEPWLIVLLSTLGGVLIGAGAAFFIRPSGAAARAARIEKEYAEYREKVADHFARTAGLVNQLTDSYKGVFEHLQQGAHELLEEDQIRERLLDSGSKTITLPPLGSLPSRGDARTEPPLDYAPGGDPDLISDDDDDDHGDGDGDDGAAEDEEAVRQPDSQARGQAATDGGEDETEDAEVDSEDQAADETDEASNAQDREPEKTRSSAS